MAARDLVKSIDITAENQWTEEMMIHDVGMITIENTNLVATITLMGRAAGGSNIIIDTLSIGASDNGKYKFDALGEIFKVGVASGDFTSGAGTIYLKG